jgi:endonuclease YncB( thermonuclease family)
VRSRSALLLAASVALSLTVGIALASGSSSTPSASPTATTAPTAPTTKATARPVAAELLFAAKGGDGDSWKDLQGREYRLGLINTPELSECFGQAASDERKALVRKGFRARPYSKDSYGRLVSVVTLADGTNLNVWLARHGYANDKYLGQFRSENPALALQLDAAFAAAKRERAGFWKACAAKPQSFVAPQPHGAPPTAAASGCHPAYSTCIPIKGDGSGNGSGNDLDCGDLRQLVLLNAVGTDPYRLDGEDQDGRGCESYA